MARVRAWSLDRRLQEEGRGTEGGGRRNECAEVGAAETKDRNFCGQPLCVDIVLRSLLVPGDRWSGSAIPSRRSSAWSQRTLHDERVQADTQQGGGGRRLVADRSIEVPRTTRR